MKIIGKDGLDGVVAKLRDQRICAEAMLDLFCGLRAGEVLVLRWDPLNLDDKLLHVRRTVLEIKRQALQPCLDAGRCRPGTARLLELPANAADFQ
jgi:integrase